MSSMFQVKGTSLTIMLPRELDHPASDEIRRQTERIMEKKYIRKIIFDFTNTSFMDSSGIGLIMGRYRALGLQSGCIGAAHVDSYIEKLLRLSGVYKVMKIEKSEDGDVQ